VYIDSILSLRQTIANKTAVLEEVGLLVHAKALTCSGSENNMRAHAEKRINREKTA
jgi:hypothetical protein